jgi:Kelch motif
MSGENHGLGTEQERPRLPRRSLLTAAGLAVSLLASPATSAAQAGAGHWTPTSLDGAPEGRWTHVAVWTGSKMIIWGGHSETDFPVTGFMYDPTADAWTPMSTPPELQICDTCAAVWTGSKMITWGPNWDWEPVGQVYDPATDSWTFITASGAPTARTGRTLTWTGSRMIVWGGWDYVNTALPQTNTGGIYDPSTDSWSPTSLVDAPSPREDHTALWTGSKMIVWGGYRREGATGILTSTGGVYDPATDTWTATSTIGAPTARDSHAAVWTGSKMIVWGGYDGVPGVPSGTGGIYDPTTNAWTPMSTVGAPSGRSDHTAVWTGSKMVVWGGTGATAGVYLDTGGVFAPPGDPGFYTVSPCRVLDSRQATGPWAGQPLGAGQERALAVVGGACGIPATAKALAFNITATSATATGHLRVYPAGAARPGSSTLNFTTGLTRANNGIVALGTEGDLSIYSGQSSGSVHVILDVSGYFVE